MLVGYKTYRSKTMIPNMWYAVLESNEVKAGKPVAFRRLGEEMVFWRDGLGQIVAMRDLCPHRQSRLSPGKIVNGNLQCHFHGFQFDRAGTCQLVPANGRNGPKPKIFQCTSFPAQEAHGMIWVWYGEPRDEYPPIPFFAGLEGLVYDTRQRQWNVDYTRAIESLLDVSHLPFVHEKTIGRGSGTLVNGPYTTLEGNELRVWISNQPDEGIPALRPTQVPPPNRPADLWFNFPNIWQLHLEEKLRVVQFLVPVDDENTILYMRQYQGFVTVPVLSRLVAWAGNLYNSYVAGEDERIVVTQVPKKSGLEVGQRFIPGDRPIALYLQHRRDLIQGNTNQEDTKTMPAPVERSGTYEVAAN
jgi:phenylpropionate dioxygenase-like ring-hydroxylating dioxygenase large terminal subunit